ncbi:Lipoxygenase [Hypoxylon sp. FL0543]|nr:Lipoxygenase [Hypoxylon sp. FL0543]
MHPHSLYVALGAFAITSEAFPQPRRFTTRQVSNDTSPACIPQSDSDPKARAQGVATRKAGFEYGPSLIGQAAPFPNGTLGNARSQYDMDLWSVDRDIIDNDVAKDVAAIQQAITANGGLKSLDDYVNVLYKGEWENSNPLEEAPGIMTNYTEDLLFSMERLSQNPYPLQLVKPSDPLPFQVPAGLTENITGVSLETLHKNESLYVVDHSYQKAYEKTTVEPKRYGAAATAYFYIHPLSGYFLPLAIKTNTGSDLIYTPLDTPNDWLLAKMIFNVNDMFHSQMFHLVATHDVSEAVHQAALHTLSEKHPIMIILERLMKEAYSSRIVGEQLCFNPGGHWDQLFYVNNAGCRLYVTDNWKTHGAYQSGYLLNDFRARGLIDENDKFKFKYFPFFEDAYRIRNTFHNFFTSFIDSYYASDAVVNADTEVKNWFAEATNAAHVSDFPASNSSLTKSTLVDVLTHFAFIVSVVHHGLNGGDPVGSKATLPFHLNALYAPLPTEKGVTDLLPFLPPPDEAVHYIGFLATFNRPFYRTSERTLEYAFSDEALLKRLNEETRESAATFMEGMKELSEEIQARKFGKDGLSQGMPFVYRTLDPGYIPFFSAV